MYCRLITRDQDLETFALRFEEFSGVKFPFQYLRQSKVYGIFLGSSMVGGFNFTSGTNIRWLNQIDEVQSTFLQEVDKSLLFEVNGLWLSENVRKSRNSIQAWTLIAGEIVKHDLPVPTFAVLHSKPKLRAFYEKIGFGKVYTGPMIGRDEMISVYHVSKLKLRFFKLFYAADYLARIFQGRVKVEPTSQNQHALSAGSRVQAVHIEPSVGSVQ